MKREREKRAPWDRRTVRVCEIPTVGESHKRLSWAGLFGLETALKPISGVFSKFRPKIILRIPL